MWASSELSPTIVENYGKFSKLGKNSWNIYDEHKCRLFFMGSQDPILWYIGSERRKLQVLPIDALERRGLRPILLYHVTGTPCEQTHMTENITFPKPSNAIDKNHTS